MYVSPKHRLQSKSPVSQKSVVVMLEPAVEELSRPVDGAGISELDDGVVPLESEPDDGVVPLESELDEEQRSIPDLLSPGV
jgi:hypothetical protein